MNYKKLKDVKVNKGMGQLSPIENMIKMNGQSIEMIAKSLFDLQIRVNTLSEILVKYNIVTEEQFVEMLKEQHTKALENIKNQSKQLQQNQSSQDTEQSPIVKEEEQTDEIIETDDE